MRTFPQLQLALSVALPLLAAAPLYAQEQVVISYFHGTARDAGVISDTERGGIIRGRTRLQYPLRAGTEVCLRVENPHPLFYSYQFGRRVDTSEPPTPAGLAALAPILRTQLGLGTEENVAGRGLAPDPQSAYIEEINGLNAEILLANRLIRGSDVPRLGEATNEDDPREFDAVRRGIISLADTQTPLLNLTDAELSQRFDALFEAAKEGAADDTQAGLILSLRAHQVGLARAVKDIRAAYMGAAPAFQQCEKVEGRATTLALSVQRRDTTLGRARVIGDTLVRIEAPIRYARSTVELIPIGLTAYAPKGRQYVLVNDTVRLDSDDTFRFRPGGMLLVNVASFGELEEVSVGTGLGFGVGGEGKVLSDWLLAPIMVSFRDRIRVGLGAGFSTMKSDLVRGVEADQPRPDSFEDLESLVRERREASWFLVFDFTGLKLPILP